MATGSTLGHVALWDLEQRRLAAQMRDAHGGAVTGMACLPSEPLMVTSSSDNSLKVSVDSDQGQFHVECQKWSCEALRVSCGMYL